MPKFWMRLRWTGLMIGLLAGCALNQSPADLLKQPSSAPGEAEIKSTVAQFLPPGAKLTVPMRPKPTKGAILSADVNGDGVQEIAAFYKKREKGQGLIVLQQQGEGWGKLFEAAQDMGIEFADFQDLTGDGKPEFVVGWGESAGDHPLQIFSWKNNSFTEINKLTYSQMVLDDLDGDGNVEMFILNHNRQKMTASLQMYGNANGTFTVKDQLPMTGGFNGISQMQTGLALSGKKGLFIDYGVGAHSGFTSLIVLEAGKMKDPLNTVSGKFDSTFQPTPGLSKDIDGDGIIEIDIPKEPPGTKNVPYSNMAWIHVWYQWDGSSGLKPIYENYFDYQYGYRLDFPKEWRGQISLSKQRSEDEDTLKLLFWDGQKSTEMLSIQSYFKDDWEMKKQEELRLKGSTPIALGELNGRVFVGILSANPSTLPNSFMVNEKSLRDYFRFIEL